MFYYMLNNSVLISNNNYVDLKPISEETAKNTMGNLFYLQKLNPRESRFSFCISAPELLFITKEGINLINKNNVSDNPIPSWIIDKINCRELISINTEYPFWKEALNTKLPSKWNINVLGLGDVGSTLVTGLRLLGGECINKIGIFDLDKNKVLRHLYECNQILSPFNEQEYPEVVETTMDELFTCDMFVFCVSAGIPPLGSNVKDVRLAQFDANSKIIEVYSKMARKNKFKGIFSVVSDPVDLLCKTALLSSNTDNNGIYDFNGLKPEQIRGYGLGVMNARAVYYARQSLDTIHYEKEGRAFGPHGDGLIIADSITNYNEALSLYLTDRAQNANIEVRNTGFKPYIAPALSSGALSIIDTIKGRWNYSSTYMGGVFIGAKNRLLSSGVEIEQLDLNPQLINRLNSTYERLSKYI